MRWILWILMLCTAPACSRKAEPNQASQSGGEPSRSRAASDEPAASGNYEFTKESRFDVKTGKAGMLGGLAHGHLVRARSFEGRMSYDPKDLEHSTVRIRVQVEGLEVLTEADAGDRKKIREAMLNKVLKAKEHPEILFESRKLEAAPQGLRVEGDLTLVGKTRPVSVDVVLGEKGDRLSARGTFSIKQTDFGIKPYKAALGTIQVADRVTFDFEAVAARK